MKVTYRQVSILTFMSFIALKFAALPSLLYEKSENMGWLVALALMSIDALFAVLIISLMRKNQNKNIYEFMCETLGVVLTKIFLAVLLVKYAFVLVNLTKSLEMFVIENFYSELHWSLFVLPLIGVVGFMVYKGIQNIARVYEMFFWAIVVGCVYIASKSIQGVDAFSFLPMFKNGFLPILDGAFSHMAWFGSSTFLIILFGKVDFNKNKQTKFTLYVLFSILLVMLMYFVFYGVFGITSPIHNFALSDISQYVRGNSLIDELSWLIIALWVVAQAVQIAMIGYCFVSAFSFLFNVKSRIVPILILNVLIFVWGYINREFIYLENIFFNPFVSVVTIIAQYVIPTFMWIGYAVTSKKNRREMEAVNEKV